MLAHDELCLRLCHIPVNSTIFEFRNMRGRMLFEQTCLNLEGEAFR